MPISYAVGYAMAQDFEECTMRELFRYADKNMYVDKNRAKIEEAAQYQQLKFRLLDEIKAQNLQFSDCLYCDALLDQYSVLRATADFYLAEEGSYFRCGREDRGRAFLSGDTQRAVACASAAALGSRS